ncbi:hypothetical protein JIN84_12500 [Luteolibacter yonseiensis]|uniref:PepSY domain-containing protein n=2 Tax=Luteolibacter yonseiensis TaxID=1144680 RepID=A0A934R7B9_9BACT|nr:hypothetical protein [Luteolibacter yonseiensis]
MKAFLLLTIVSTTFAAQAKEVRLKDCPPGVQITIAAKLGGGRLDEIDRVNKKGVTRYVVDVDGPGGRDITYHLTPAGHVVFSTEDVSLAGCPAAVRNSIRKLLKNGWRIDDIDREISGKSVRFRVEIDRPQERDYEFLLSKNGKVLERKLEKGN